MMPCMDSDALISLAADLIRAPSPSGSESQAAAVLMGAFRDLGFDEAYIDPAGNAIGVFRRGDGPTIMFNGHLDTVPLGDEALWPHPPLSGIVSDGRLWGRGACDMKASLACMAVAAADAARAGIQGTLIVAGVVQEETGGLGARYLGQQTAVDVIVLGEPSDGALKLGHRGRVEFEVTFPGRIAHAANAELGENALFPAARFLNRMEQLELPTGGPLNGSSATPTCLVSFPVDGPNVVPGSARLTVDYRTIPGDDVDDIQGRIQGICDDPRIVVAIPTEQAVSEDGSITMEFSRQVGPYLAPAESNAVETARRAIAKALPDEPAREGVWWFATDAPHLVALGGVVIGFGPGEEDLAHTTQESVRVDRLLQAREVYRAFARAFLPVVSA